MGRFVNYHKHSHYSNVILPDSVATNEDYCKRAVEFGQSVLSSCEHGTSGNYRECCDLAKKYGLKWVYVAEAYFVEDRNTDDRVNAHLILAARTEKGMYDLNEVLSEAHISGYYYRPRVDLELLLRLDPKDVLITTACVGGLWNYGYTRASEMNSECYDFRVPDELIRILHRHFGDSMMLEVQYHNVEKQKMINRHILDLYRELGIRFICGLDSHYIHEEDRGLRDQLLESKHLQYADEDGWYMDYPDEDTVYRRFVEQGVLSPAQIREAMDNTSVFLTFEDIDFSKDRKLPTLYPDKTQEERNQMYRDLITDKWTAYRSKVPESEWAKYEEGIRYEADTITDTNTSDYFLLSYEFVKRYRALGGQITKTGRGSAPSYFTNTLLGLSSIDRFQIPVTMYPDRFVSRDRLKTSMPDIDNNISDQRLGAEALADVMGPWHSAQMVAFGTLKRLSAWKMYCRAAGVDFEVANKISDELKRYELDVKHADEDEADSIDIYDYVPSEYHEQLRMSERYLGMIDSISPHPCAFLLCQNDIRREIGVFRLNSKTGKKNTIYAAFIDGATADAYGYLKEDLLVVDVVKVNADIYNRIGIPQPTVPELIDMTAGDRATWQMYAKGLTLGLNQCERDKTIEKVKRYKPKNLTEMSAFVAGIRPGFQSMVDKLLDRKHFDYKIPALDTLLQTREMPSSFILYQEQVMAILQWAGLAASESYAAIKAIAKKHPEKVKPLKERFLFGFSSRLVSESGLTQQEADATAATVWGIVEDNTSYSFNCVSGDTVILRDSNKSNCWHPTIAEMYRAKHDRVWAKENGHRSLYDKYNREGYGSANSLQEDGRIRVNSILDIVDAGVQMTYKITTAAGRTIRATASHKFPVGSYDNLVELRNLSVGDKLFVRGSYEKNTHRYLLGGRGNLPVKGQRGFQTLEDGNLYPKTRERYSKEARPCECCGAAFTDSLRFELHHIDGDRTNNHLDNYRWLCVSCHKKEHYRMGRVSRYQKGIPSEVDEIISIEPYGEEPVYDVVMGDKYHNFVIDNGIVTGNCSHSVSVALDSIYTAWAKAHYPLETYVALMSNYAEKGDKDRIDRARQEMKAFGIRCVPPRFRQDNRDYYIDRKNKTISDALMSIKHISKRVADALYAMRNKRYATFVDLLYDMTMSPSFTTQVIEILIRLGYFEEFGGSEKLYGIFCEFTDGASKFSKSHVERTQVRRLQELREKEAAMPDADMPSVQKVSFEIEVLGTPMTVDPAQRGMFAVLDIDEKYSPKVTLYNIERGTTGVMKIRKATYKQKPLKVGQVIEMIDWKKKPAYSFVDGKSVKREGVYDLWLEEYV